MNTPTEAQLKDLKWWDENIGSAIRSIAIETDPHGGLYEIHKFLSESGAAYKETSRFGNDIRVYKRPATPEWDGEGLPPVGCECEMANPMCDRFELVEIIAHKGEWAIYWDGSSPGKARSDWFRPLRTKAERLAQHLAERDAFLAEDAEPQSEQEPVADRIMELGNQVHNLACEVQNDEALAGELEDIRGRLWDLAGKVRKVRELEEKRREVIEVCHRTLNVVGALSGPLSTQKILETLYDTGMLRKAGDQ